MRSLLKESISCYLIRLSPLILVPIGLFHRTQSPLSFTFLKTIIVFWLVETIMVIHFLCLLETIKSIGMWRQSWSFAFSAFQRQSSLLACKDDAILPRKGPVTRAMSNRFQEDCTRAAEEGPRVLMNLRIGYPRNIGFFSPCILGHLN